MFVEFGALILAMGVLGEQFIDFDAKSGSDYPAASMTNMSGAVAVIGGAGIVSAKTVAAQVEYARASAAVQIAEAEEGAAKTALLEKGTGTQEAYRAANVKHGLAAGRQATAEGNLEEWDKKSSRLSIIGVAMIVVALLEQTAGFGPPHAGTDFKAGSDQFAAIYDQLGSAFPDDGWQGPARAAYCGQNVAQLNGLRSMADLDCQLAGVIKDQADVVTYVRWGFGILMVLLAIAYFYELEMACLPLPDGPIAAESYATLGAKIGIGVAVTMVLFLLGWSVYNKTRADDVADGYRALAADARAAMTGPVQVPAVPRCTAAGLATAPTGANIAPLAGGAGGAGDGHAAATAEEKAPSMSVFTVPRAAQGAAGRAGTGVGRVSRQTSQANRTSQTVERPSAGAAPAEDTAGAVVAGTGAAWLGFVPVEATGR